MSENCFINTTSFMDFLQTFWQSYAWDVLILLFQYGNLTSLQLHCVILNDYLIETKSQSSNSLCKIDHKSFLNLFFQYWERCYISIFIMFLSSSEINLLHYCWMDIKVLFYAYIYSNQFRFFFFFFGNFKNLGDN